MTTHNDQAKTLLPLLLDERGAGGEGVLRYAKIALAALFLATSNAALADNECDAATPSDNGATADSYNCSDASYDSGVTYTADGDLTIDFDRDTTTTIGGTGITLAGDGVEDITFDSNAPTTTIFSQSGMDGNLLGITTVDGDILITTSVMDADTTNAENVDRAIFAQATGSGSIDITTTGFVDAASNTNPDTSIGIEAITGSGSLTITATNSVSGNDVGIDATTGSGLLTINANGSGTISGIRTDAGGNAVINIASAREVNGGSPKLDLTAVGETTLNNAGTIGISSLLGAAMKVSGGTFVLNNTGTIHSLIDLSDLNGGYTFNNDGVWNAHRERSDDPTSFLGAGVLTNAGTIRLEPGTLIMASGTNYTGDDGLLEYDVRPGVMGQTDCANPTVSGCLYLAGGSTAGTTTIRPVFLNVRGQESLAAANTGIVLVDVGGGSSAAEHFVLDATVEGYSTDETYGSIIDMGEGVIDYTLLYNPKNRQHVLAPVPQREGVEYVSFIHEALSIWHTTADVVAGRQFALREQAKRGAWARLSLEQTDRESAPTFSTHGNDFTYGQDYTLRTGTAMFGFDISASDEHLVGFHIGYVKARGEHEDGSDTVDRVKGATLGAYGGWGRDGMTLDGAINANLLTLDHGFGTNPKELEESESSIQSLGIRLDAGYRQPVLGDFLYVQPVAGVSYVTADIKELELRDNDLSFEDTTSLRIGVGFRVGGDLITGGDSKVGYWLSARRLEERENEGRVLFEVRDGADLEIRDDASGTFHEFDFGVNWGSREAGAVSGYLAGGARFDKDDDNDSYNFSMGVRKNW